MTQIQKKGSDSLEEVNTWYQRGVCRPGSKPQNVICSSLLVHGVVAAFVFFSFSSCPSLLPCIYGGSNGGHPSLLSSYGLQTCPYLFIHHYMRTRSRVIGNLHKITRKEDILQCSSTHFWQDQQVNSIRYRNVRRSYNSLKKKKLMQSPHLKTLFYNILRFCFRV